MTSPTPSGKSSKNSAVALTAGGNNIELGKYRILRLLGQGGFGITYLAQDMETGQEVVVKENLPTDFAHRDTNTLTIVPLNDDAEANFKWAMESFLHEARLLMQLNHPNIVKVQDAFSALGTAYYVMPWVGGTELAQAAPAPGEITETWLAPILRQLLEALQYLHSQNLLHRDIKPSNILMSEGGAPVIIDFGAARAIISEKSATKVGSPGYTPIEQVQSKGKRGPWTDLYALGATCYRLITGTRPPQCEDRMGEDDEYRPLAPQAELYSRFSRQFLAAIDKALAVWGKNRWLSAEEWLSTLPEPGPVEPTPEPIAIPTSALVPPNESSNLTKAVSMGDTEMVQQLLSAGADVNQTDEDGRTPLYTAVANGYTEVVRLLLTAPGIDVNHAPEDGNTPLYWAAWQGHTEVVRLLLAAPGIDIDKACQVDQWTRLHFAAAAGLTDMVQQQLARGADVNAADYNNDTPLYMAASNGHTEVVRLLLAAPCIDVNKTCEFGVTPLYMAASKGHTEVVRLLLAVPSIDVNKTGGDGRTPLYMATWRGHTEVVRLLLAAPGADIDKANKYGWTPLYRAADEGHTEVIRLLLAVPGIDVNKADKYGWTPLDKAKTDEIKSLLRAAGGKNRGQSAGEWLAAQPAPKPAQTITPKSKPIIIPPGSQPNPASAPTPPPRPAGIPLYGKILLAAMLLLLLGGGWYAYRTISGMQNQLNLAETQSKQATAKTDRKAAEKNKQRETQNQRQQAISILTSQGISSSDYNSKLREATAKGNLELVQLLLTAGADVNAASSDNLTPLHYAAYYNHTEIALALVNKGAYIEAKDKQGATPLYIAALSGHTETALALINKGAYLEARTNENATPLYAAAYNGHTETVLILINKGAYLEARTNESATPLYAAAQLGHTETALILIDKGANIETKFKTNATPLIIATEKGYSNTVQVLIDKGANIEAKDNRGVTPLIIAAYLGKTDTVRTLLKHGANRNAKDKWGKTALDRAREKGHTDIVHLLR